MGAKQAIPSIKPRVVRLEVPGDHDLAARANHSRHLWEHQKPGVVHGGNVTKGLPRSKMGSNWQEPGSSPSSSRKLLAQRHAAGRGHGDHPVLR